MKLRIFPFSILSPILHLPLCHIVLRGFTVSFLSSHCFYIATFSNIISCIFLSKFLFHFPYHVINYCCLILLLSSSSSSTTDIYFLLSDCKGNHIVQIAYLPSGWNCFCYRWTESLKSKDFIAFRLLTVEWNHVVDAIEKSKLSWEIILRCNLSTPSGIPSLCPFVIM